MDRAVLMIVITDRSRGGEFASWFQAQGATLVLSALGRGTAATEVLDYLGLEATEKAVLLLAAPRSARLVRKAARELWLDVPGRGILMAVPISSVGGARARDYLLSWQAEEDDDMDKEITHELIVVIANRGHTDQVMDAARSAGAAGGTTIHAKGTGTELARKFLGVSLAAEKEIVFILAKEAARKPIMKAVMTQAGMQTKAQAVVFSLPVTDLAGLRLLEEDGES
ncbi:P-II family nitrogen regulator [Oscillibacter sp.]|uniref:P-II family nitrogen regulator n=1 Tax=Oscillibacter sp. TaxID=1945593 RepID=UPI002D7E3B99|nr:P-II family nitrogen regulator [Oscillibacter sp.]